MNKNNNYFETIVGTFVLFAAIFFFFSSLKSSKVSSGGNNYELIAKFDNIDGLAIGSDVKISGVKVGTISAQSLDEKTYRATLHIVLRQDVRLSADSSAKIASEGLLGSKYLSLEPGGEDEILKSGDEIKFTQSSVNLEELLGKFIFSANSDTKKEDDKK